MNVRVGLVLVGALVAGCAAERRPPEWPVMTSLGPDEVEVYVRNRLVIEGEPVDLYAVECRRIASTVDVAPACNGVYVGKGKVVSVPDGKYAIVRLPPGVTVRPGALYRLGE